MATRLIIEDQIEIPMDLRSLADFRRWAASDAFPERGRIDWIAGRIEVDMSPEEVFCHGSVKSEIHGVLYNLVKNADLGYLFVDSTRMSSPVGDVSAEPDIVFVSHEALATGRVTLVPKAGGEEGRFVELEGAPELIVEIVSDSSVGKDTRRLPAAYFRAGVDEFWLVDARRPPIVFRIHRRGPSEYEPVEADAEGFQRSVVLGCSFRLEGRRGARGYWAFDLLRK